MSIVETLSPAEAAEIETELGLSGSPLSPRKPRKLLITYNQLLEFRTLEVPLDDFWVRVSNEASGGIVPASKVAKYTALGYTPD